MAIAHDATGAAPTPRRRVGDTPLVRAVGRVRLPLGAKLVAGFLAVGALLALVAALGLSALGQSNTRGQQLRRLQQRATYYQLVLTDASQLKTAIDYRIENPSPEKTFGSTLDQTIVHEFNQLCVDTGGDACLAGAPAAPPPAPPPPPPPPRRDRAPTRPPGPVPAP